MNGPSPSARPASPTPNDRPAAFPLPLRAGISALSAVAPRLVAHGLAELCMRPPRHRPPAHERAALRGAEEVDVPFAGGVLRGWRRGQGPAVLLLHGWGGRSGQMAPLAEAVVRSGCAAVALDAPAHGRSDGRVVSVPVYADAVAAAAEAVGARAAVGHSFGGAALAFAASRGLDLDAAVLIGAPAAPAAFVDAFCDSLSLGRRARAALRQRLEERVGHRFEELELVRTLAGARGPALVVHDRDDREVEFSDGEALARAWPGARLHATAGLGHRRILRDRTLLAEVAAFLAAQLG